MYVVPDVSEHNPPLTDAYGRDAIIVRAAFGDYYKDQNFLHNTGVVAELWKAGKLDGGCVLYQPYIEPGTPKSHFDYLWELIGPKPEWLTGILIDEESWTGAPYAQHGNKSDALNRLAGMHAQRMGSWRSVKGYANLSDFNALWPHRDPRIDINLAAYTGRLSPGVVAHQVAQQYTDGQSQWGTPMVARHSLPRVTGPFGQCDHNVFFNVNNATQFRALWGRPPRGGSLPSHKPPVRKPPAKKPPEVHVPKPSTLVARTPDGHGEIHFFNDLGLTIRRDGQHVADIYTANKGA